MLNRVRNSGFGVWEFSVVWLQPLAAPTIIVACGPPRMSAAMATTEDTDMLEPLAIGNWTLNADVSDDRKTRKTSGSTGVKVARGSRRMSVAAPRAMTKMMYQRPRRGRSRSKTGKYTAARPPKPDRSDRAQARCPHLTSIKQMFYTNV